MNMLNSLDKTFVKKFLISMILMFVGFIFPPIALFFLGRLIYITWQYIKDTQNLIHSTDMLYNEISLNPSDEAVDRLKDFIEQNGCIDKPNNWNKLKGVWVSINESPNVTTEKKKEIIQFLRLKGLTMYYKEAEVIDNYGQQTKKATQ